VISDILKDYGWKYIHFKYVDCYDKYNFRLLDDSDDTGYWILMDKNGKGDNVNLYNKEFMHHIIDKIRTKDLLGYITKLERDIKIGQII